jgi:hypothetical protein
MTNSPLRTVYFTSEHKFATSVGVLLEAGMPFEYRGRNVRGEHTLTMDEVTWSYLTRTYTDVKIADTEEVALLRHEAAR